MLLPAILFLLVIILLAAWLIAEKKTKYRKDIDEYKKEYTFSPFFSVALAILDLFGLTEDNAAAVRGIFRKKKEKMQQQMKTLYGNIEYTKRYRFFSANTVAAIYITLILGAFLLFVVSYQEAKNASGFGTELARPSLGEVDTYEVTAEFIGDNERVKKDLEVVIESQLPTEEEAEAILGEVKDELMDYMLNDNSDLQNITGDLRFPERNNSKGVDIKWETSHPHIIGKTGEVSNAALEEPAEVTINATLSIADVYSEQLEMKVTVLPKPSGEMQPQTFAEKVEIAVQEILMNLNKDLTEPDVHMPNEWNNELRIKWSAKEKSNLPVIVILTLVLGAVMIYYVSLKMKESIDERAEKIKMDFPEMLNKLVLLILAGTTVQTAMEKIIDDYRHNVERGQAKRPLYEELIMLNNSIYGDKKMAYAEAYEQFAKRCMVQEAIRFSALMIQYIRGGSDQLVSMLRLFSSEAWQERKRIAERRGKAAENKLLLPILLMFMAVLIIVLTPLGSLIKI